MDDITALLNTGAKEDSTSARELLPLVYEELRKLAGAKMAGEATGQTLQPTALVHEAWLRLSRQENRRWNDRRHFFAAAAEAMRRILVDNARRKRRIRHGGGRVRVELPDIAEIRECSEDQLLAVNEALDHFARRDSEKAELVKLRYFVGMSLEQAAEALGFSEATAKRHWAYARAWLGREINRDGE